MNQPQINVVALLALQGELYSQLCEAQSRIAELEAQLAKEEDK